MWAGDRRAGPVGRGARTSQLEVDRHVAAPVEVVWDVLVDWERQSDWMVDARRVDVVTPHRTGRGVTVHVPTMLLGVPVLDVMRITGWDPPRRLEATHLGGVIRGVGVFDLAPEAGGTRLRWIEEIDPPLGSLGAFVAVLALPILHRIFAVSLRRLAALAEAEVAGRIATPAGRATNVAGE